MDNYVCIYLHKYIGTTPTHDHDDDDDELKLPGGGQKTAYEHNSQTLLKLLLCMYIFVPG